MSKIFEVSERDLPRLFREVEAKRPTAVQRGIASAIMLNGEIVARVAPKDQGDLKRSCRGVLAPGGGYVIADAPHAGIVEMGARPHWTPIGPLFAWAKRHGANTEQEAWALAYGIRAKIAADGQKPTYFMRKTLPKQKQVLKAEIEREMALADK